MNVNDGENNSVTERLIQALSVSAKKVEQNGAVKSPTETGSLLESISGLQRELIANTQTLYRSSGVLEENTKSLYNLGSVQSSLLKGVGSSLANVGKGTSLFSFLGISPLISAVTKLFKRDKTPEPVTFVPYQAPEPVRYSFDTSAQKAPEAQTPGSVLPAMSPAPMPTAISVNVTAMDSKSFLDHSDEIASAVKEALLQSHSIQDVLREL